MVKRLSDLLLLLRQKSYVHQHLLYRLPFGRENEEKKEISIQQKYV